MPPRAQAAHQQASHMVKQISAGCAASRCTPYRYRDFGSLVSLGEYSTVGNLMGGLIGGNLLFEGWFARMMYLSLYKMHELALHGFWKMALDTAGAADHAAHRAARQAALSRRKIGIDCQQMHEETLAYAGALRHT